MRFIKLICVCFLLTNCNLSKPSIEKSPNIIYILADDLGYGELGSYGQTLIETPNLDILAKQGMLFTQHYSSAPVCAPARYMLMTGQHSGHAYIRGNDEWDERGDVWNYKAVAKDPGLEGQRPMPKATVTLAHRLKSVGYTTAIFGKWGLGAPESHSIPTKMGFDYFYGYNCQRQAHTYYPVHLYENEHRVPLSNDTIAPHTKLDVGVSLGKRNNYSHYTQNQYAPTLIKNKILAFVKEERTRPFFLYWATPIPHNPLQAPQHWVEYYQEKFGKEAPYDGNKGYFPNQTPRATYAAMISFLDENIGALINTLKDKGLYENTMIIFTSDNGVTYSGGTDGSFFNSSGIFGENYGKGKGFVYEGGIRVPMIASWPGKIPSNSISNHISAQYDLLATMSDLTGFSIAEEQDGISFLPTLLGQSNQKKHDFLYWEFPEYGGQIAIRIDNYKWVRQHLNDSLPSTIELYNLDQDPEESNNIADLHPELKLRALEIFSEAHSKSKIKKFQIPILEKGLFSKN